MSRRGNCRDDTAMESFFQLLKRERIKRKAYNTHDEARSDVFDHVEMFYNPRRRHDSSGDLSTSKAVTTKRLTFVYGTLGDSDRPRAL